jgi:transposase
MNYLECRAKITLTISEERKKRVIDLYYNQGKTMREIAKIERMSIRDISAIIKEEEARRQKYKRQQQQVETSSKAYELFSQGKTPLQVAISLKIRQSVATKYYKEYWKLIRLHKLISIYKETNGKLAPFLKLYKQLIKQKGMSVDQVVNAVDISIHKLPHMESLYIQAKDQAEKMQRTVQLLANDVAALEHKISILDKIVFASEQDCKRKEQQVQELTAKKNRLKKLIANILNGEVYSKLKQVAKENAKAALFRLYG